MKPLNPILILPILVCFLLPAQESWGQSKNNITDTIVKQVVLFEVRDDQGNAKEFITQTERKIVEAKIHEYEKQKNITDRAGYIYIINSKYEVVSIKEKQKL